MKLDLENFVDNPDDWTVARIDRNTGTIEVHEKGYVESYKVRQHRRSPVKHTAPESILDRSTEMDEATKKVAWRWAQRFQKEFDILEAQFPGENRKTLMHAAEIAMRRKLRRKINGKA